MNILIWLKNFETFWRIHFLIQIYQKIIKNLPKLDKTGLILFIYNFKSTEIISSLLFFVANHDESLSMLFGDFCPDFENLLSSE